MKQRFLTALLLAALYSTADAQVTPQSTAATHSDSCWYFTFDYDTPDVRRDEGILVVTHICTPDTCISSARRHIQGQKYARQYARQYGHRPELITEAEYCCTLSMPESAVTDTIWGVTYCEYTGKEGVRFECDTVAIGMPQAPPMSCHRVMARRTIADHIAKEHPYVKSIGSYAPIDDSGISSFGHIPAVVRYTTNSDRLNPAYLNNAENAEELMVEFETVKQLSGGKYPLVKKWFLDTFKDDADTFNVSEAKKQIATAKVNRVKATVKKANAIHVA